MQNRILVVYVFASLSFAACDLAPELNNGADKSISSNKSQPNRPALLDGAYDPAVWEWQLQPDNHYFLVHKSIHKCFMLTDWPMDSPEEEEPKRATAEKMLINGQEYTVTTIPRSTDGGEIHFSRNTKPIVHLSVFGSYSCHAEAKKVVVAYEERRVETN